ncbi:hypothetical protein QAD02_006525 [Eretmocerus hayati]|uniref:Uncharacterized protein n=1 Tax=Eretmocerus hayati TaxID=131215 RepID=A0ACC2N290_9HYME|nr:hypothetical protein QAD02_006525 [Eretmocerus hayati]
MIIFVYLISIIATLGNQGYARVPSISKIPLEHKEQHVKSSGLHVKSDAKYGHGKLNHLVSPVQNPNKDNIYGPGSKSDNNGNPTEGYLKNALKLVDSVGEAENNLRNGLNNFADNVQDGGKKVFQDAIEIVQEKGIEAINVTVDRAADASESAINTGFDTLEIVGVDKETITDYSNSTNIFIENTRDFTKEFTSNIVRNGTEVLNATGIEILDGSTKTLKNVVSNEINAFNSSVPKIFSGVVEGDFNKARGASLDLASKTLETGQFAVNGIADTFGNATKKLGSGVVDLGINSVHKLVEKGVNSAVKVAKNRGVKEEVANKVGGIVINTSKKYTNKAKSIANEVIGKTVNVVKARYTLPVNTAANSMKGALNMVQERH